MPASLSQILDAQADTIPADAGKVGRPKPAEPRQKAPSPSDFEAERLALMQALEGRQWDQLDVDVTVASPAAGPPADPSGAPPQKPGEGAPPASPDTVRPPSTVSEAPPNSAPATPASPLPPDALAAEKAALEARAAELARKEAAFLQAQRKHQEELAGLNLETERVQTSAEEYEKLAGEYEKEGDDGMAQAARERAAMIRRQAATVQARAQAARFESQQAKADAATVEKFPELKDPNSELAKEVVALFKARPSLAREVDGLALAAVHADALRQGRKSKSLAEKLAQTEQALAEREKLLQPGTGAPSAGTVGTASWDNLPLEQQREALRGALRNASEQGVNLL